MREIGCCDPDGWCSCLNMYIFDIKECTATAEDVEKETSWKVY